MADISPNMPVTLKLYASLSAYLPEGHARNAVVVQVSSGTTIQDLLDSQRVPREACHLVLQNGVYRSPSTRAAAYLNSGDVVAVWPPVAGG